MKPRDEEAKRKRERERNREQGVEDIAKRTTPPHPSTPTEKKLRDPILPN